MFQVGVELSQLLDTNVYMCVFMCVCGGGMCISLVVIEFEGLPEMRSIGILGV